ncbi:MAG: RNA polymerase sigma factor [Candidatus Parcubacteria bacterium]|nr:RNA polymerase sigma factor [Burkholderiales bacterium]
MEVADEQLMLSYRDGDAGAFEQLYKRHKGGLYRFVLRSIRDRAVAEELYQEIWMRAIEARGRYEVQARFKTWLYTIAHNRMVDHWRKRGLNLVALDEEHAALAEPHAAPDYEPQRLLEAKQSLARFAAALQALPPAQREAFLLHQEAGMSVAEISQATGCNAEAAKSRLRYALSKLKQAVGDD